MKRRWLRNTLLGLGLFLVAMVIVPSVVIIPFVLLTGWVPSAARLIAGWQPPPGTVVGFLLAAAALVAGTHAFVRWLYRHGQTPPGAQDDSPPAEGRPWKWRWTLCGFGLGFCSLVAIIAFVLTAHQTYWMSKSSDPWFVNRWRIQVPQAEVERALLEATETNRWNLAQTRAVFEAASSRSSAEPVLEAVRPIWIEADDQTLKAIVLIPRRPALQSRGWITVIRRKGAVTHDKLDRLPIVMAEFGISNATQNLDRRSSLLP